MKTHRIFEAIVITGTTDEEKEWLMERSNLESIEKLAAGTHFLTAFGNKRGKRAKIATPLMDELGTDNWMDEPNPILEGVPWKDASLNPDIARIKNIDINGSAEPPTPEEVIARYRERKEASHE